MSTSMLSTGFVTYFSSFNTKLAYFILLITSLLISGCKITEQKLVISHATDQVELLIQLPEESAADIEYLEKRDVKKYIFNLDAYETLDCLLQAETNKNEQNFIGNLLHIESNNELKQLQTIRLNGDVPIQLSATYGKIMANGETEICYYQSQSFWPAIGKTYKVHFSPSCEVYGFQKVSKASFKPIKLNNTLDSCFSPNAN